MSISFIIPAYDEERLLGRTLQAIDRAAQGLGEPIEVIVVDDGSTDRTAAIARENGARVVSVRCRQIAATRNAGAREANADLLVFVDADTLVTAVHRKPGPAGYADAPEVAPSELLEPLLAPHLAVSMGALNLA